MAIVSNLDLLCRVPLFSDLSPHQLGVLVDAVDKKHFKRGDHIVEQGTTGHMLYMILSGKARVLSKDERGREVIMASLGPGDCLGEMSLIDGQPHSATVRAEAQTDVLTLGREAFLMCLHSNASMAVSVMRSLIRRLRNADRQIQALALMDVYGRVQAVLMDMAEEQADGQLILRHKVSRQDVAKMVGASREMVSRVMKHFAEEGILQRQADNSFLLVPKTQSLT